MLNQAWGGFLSTQMRLVQAPEWATAGLEKFGRNPYGERNFRVVWAPSRTRIIGGKWDDNGKHEYRRLPKYGKQPRWILERWRPASMYGSPERWETDFITPDGFYAVGPYPRHGEYESCEVFQAKDQYGRPIKGWGGFVPLEAGLVELTARAVWMGRIGTYSDIRIRLRDEELEKERRQDMTFDEMWKERQASREGLTLGYGNGFVNKQQEIDDYVRKLERRKLWINRNRFTPGFSEGQ